MKQCHHIHHSLYCTQLEKSRLEERNDSDDRHCDAFVYEPDCGAKIDGCVSTSDDEKAFVCFFIASHFFGAGEFCFNATMPAGGYVLY